MKAILATFPKAIRTCLLLTAVLACRLDAGAGAEDYAVSWQGKYINDASSSVNLRLKAPEALPNGVIWRYHEAEPKSPVAHYNQDANSAVFYGALEIVSSAPVTNAPNLRVISLSPQEDRIILAAGAGPSTTPVNIRGMLFWNKENFLNGLADQSPLDITSLSRFSATVHFIRGDAEARFAIRSGGKWYLSEEAFRLTKASKRTPGDEFALESLSSSQWAEWSPDNSDEAIGPVSTDYNIPGSALIDIQGAGIYFSSIFDKPINRAEFVLSSFQITASSK